jgi:hypothetical protein
MAIKLSQLITRKELLLSDGEVLRGFYDEVTDAIDRGELGQAGTPEPAWMNDLLEIIGDEPLLGDEEENDNYRVTDWLLTENSDLDEFLADWIEVRKQGRTDLEV